MSDAAMTRKEALVELIHLDSRIRKGQDKIDIILALRRRTSEYLALADRLEKSIAKMKARRSALERTHGLG